MATIYTFEDIEAWKKARELNKAVYACSKKRASISAMSNIAEGFEREGNAEFVQFLSVAKGSVGEVTSQLYVALDEEYITRDEFSRIKAVAQDARRLIAGFMSYLKRSKIRGQKYK